MNQPVRSPGFGEQLLKKGLPIVAFAGAAVLFNSIQHHIVANNKADLDQCQTYTFESQRNACIAKTGDRNTLLLYGAVGVEAVALGGVILTAASAVNSLSWKPNRQKR